MSAQDIVALQQVVVAKGIENSNIAHAPVAHTQSGTDGEKAGRESKGQRLWRKKRQSDGSVNDVGRLEKEISKGQSFQEDAIPAGNGYRSEDSQQGSDAPSKASNGFRRSKAKKRKSKDKGKREQRGEEYELDGLGSEHEVDRKRGRKVFYRRRRFWTLHVPLLWTVLLGIIGIMLRLFSPWKTAAHLQLWRFFLFFACLPLVYVAANYILLCLVWFFESQFFTTTNVLYYVISLKNPGRYVIMSILLLPLYIPLFLPQAALASGANTAYHKVLGVIACIIVFTAMNFLKVLFAKLMSSYFHASTHFSKMQEALDKEYYLKVLATPRDGHNAFVELLNPEGIDGNKKPQERKPSAMRRTVPGRFVSRMATQVKLPLQLSRKRASSLPTPASMDRLTEENAAAVEAEKQNAAKRPPPPARVTPVEPPPKLKPALRETFEPPDPVGPPTPRSARYGPESPSPFAYLSKASAPVAGQAAGSTVKANPAAKKTVVHFQKSLSLQRNGAGAFKDGDKAGKPEAGLARRNSDGGAGVAGILQDMETVVGHGGLAGGDRLSASVHPSAALQAAIKAQNQLPSSMGPEDHDVKSSRRGRAEGSSSSWARQWQRRRCSDRSASAIKEDLEPDSPVRLPVTAEEMTNEQGTALVATIHQVEKHLRKRQMAVPFTDQLKCKDGSSTEQEARKLAFFIFWNVKPFFDRNYILQSDLEAFLSPKRAAEAFEMLDRDGDNHVTLAELRKSINEIFNERTNLSVQLRDTKSVVGKLETVIGAALHITAIFFYLMIFGVDIRNVWVLFTSIFLGFAFIFGNSIKNLFEAVLYLFVQHPFDVGDILIMENNDRVKVEEISLSTVVMRRGDGMRLWVPTTSLVPKTCQNISRSDNKSEGFKFLVDIGISASVLQEIDRKVGEFIESRDTDFAPSCQSVQLSASSDPLKVALNVGFEYTHNGVDIGKLSQARSDLLQVVSDTLTELGVIYTQAPLRTWTG